MFGLGGGELILVIVLAVLLIGPKDLPKVASQLGRWYRQFKFATHELKNTIEKEIHKSDQNKSTKSDSSQL